MPIDPNKLSAFLAEQDAQATRSSSLAAPAIAPADMGRAQSIASKRGLPPLVVADSLADWDERERLDATEEAAKQSPAFARWFQAPEHAALAKGEEGKVGLFARALEQFNKPLFGVYEPLSRAMQRALQRSRIGESFVQGDVKAFANAKQSAADLLDTPTESLRFLYGQSFDPLGTRAASEEAAGVAAEVRKDQKTTFSAVGARPTGADFLRDPFGAFEQATAYYAVRGAASAPAMSFALAARNPRLAAGLMGAPTGAQTYSDLRAEGLPKWQAAAAGVATGGAEILGERVGLDSLLAVPLRNAFTRGVATEAGQEAVTQLLQDNVEGYATGQAPNVYEQLSNAFDAAVLGGGFGATVAGVRGAATRDRINAAASVSGSVEGSRRVADIVQTVGELGLGKHSPDALRRLAEEASPEAKVYLSAEQARTLFQSERLSADAFVADLVGDDSALREAEATGGDVVIPMAAFVSKVATLPNAADIAQHVRLQADHLSRAELESDALDERLAEWFGDTGEAADRADPESGKADSGEQVTQDVLGMLLASGRYRPADAELQAQVVGRVFGRMAARSGQDAFDLYSRYKLRINDQGGRQGKPNTLDPRTDALLTDIRRGAIPDGPAVFGDSLLSFLVKRGGVQDSGGELVGRDALRQRPGLVNRNGVELDMAREAAAEAGYLPEDADLNALLDAMDQELRGEPVYSEQFADKHQLARRTQALDLQRAMDENEAIGAMTDAEFQSLSNQDLHDLLFPPERSLLQRAGDKVRSLFQSRPVAPGPAAGVEFARAEEDLKSRLEQWGVAESGDDPLRGFGFDRRESASGRPDSDPENADADVRGTSRERKTAAGHRLIEAAKSGGFFISKDEVRRIEASAWGRSEGAEHDVHFVGAEGAELAIRATANGNFGPLADITPAEYLQRLRDFNQVFPETQIRVFGVSEDADGNAVIWSAQPFVKGEEFATEEELAAAMAAHGWKRDNTFPRYTHEATGAIIEDAHTGNILHIGDELFPIDVIVEKLPNAGDRELYQPADGSPRDRGRLRIGVDRTMAIDLFRGADLSTFLHESAHLFLEVMQDVAETSPEVRADLDAIRAWNDNTGGAFTEDQHEQFARGWEAYLREGKAPAPELVSMFGRFRAWLLDVYRALAQLNVTLTDEVRGVFDRMLATDEEVEAAQVRQGMQPLTLADEARALLSPGQWEAYVAATAAATEEARNEVLGRLLRAHKREAEAWWKEQLAAVRAEVEAEFEAAPVVRAWRVLAGRGEQPEHLRGLRLDRQALVDAYGAEWVKEKLLRLGVYRKSGGVSPDTAAAALGFSSGDALVKSLAEVRDLQARIDEHALARMRERHPEPMTDGSLPELAMDAVHSDRRVAALEAEQQILATLAKQPAPPARLVREYARRKIAALTLRAVRPNDYLVAERKAARLATKAAAQGDYAEALQHKRAQALNAALYSEARQGQERAEKQIRALRKLAGDKARERIGKAGKSYLDALDALLEGHELRPVSAKEIRRREALRTWAEEQQDDMGVTVLAPELLARIEAERVTNVADLTLQQLTDLHETAENIAHLARLKNRLLKGKEARDWDDAKGELLERMRAVLDESTPPPFSDADLKLLQRMGEAYSGFMDWMLRPETVVEWLDGGEAGPWHDYFWGQMEAGEAERARLRRKVAEPLVQLLTTLPKAERKALDEVVFVPSLGRSVSRNTILSLLLNLGTASSRDKLLRGGMMVDGEVVPFAPEQVQELLGHLSAAQANIAQQVWDALDGLWPEIQAQQEALSGFAPEKLEPLPVSFTTRDGQPATLRGGYYPAVYDPRAGQGGVKQAQAEEDRLLGGNFTPAVTSKGHTKERTQYAAPMLLDFHAVLSRHLNNVITDLAYRQPLRQMLRILGDSTIKGVIHQRMSAGAYHALLGSVRATIGGTNGISEPASTFFEKVKGGVVRNTVVAALGFKVGLLVANTVTAPLLATARVAPRFVLQGLARYWRHPQQITAMVHDLSPFMLDRATNTDQGYADVLAELRGKHGLRHRIAEASLALHRWITPLVERGIWLGRYMEATRDGAGPDEAVRLADKAIRQTQTQNAPKDLSAVERDPRYKVFNLFLGPMIIANNRLQEAGLRGKLRGAVESPAQALGVWFAMVVANGALFELLSGRGPDDDDEDGLDAADWGAWLARKALLFPAQTMPFVRNAANAIDAAFGGDVGSARPDPLTDAMSILVKFGKASIGAAHDAMQGEEVDVAKVTKAGTRAAGVAVGLPTGQAMTTGSYLYDLATDPETPLDPRYLIYKRD